MKIELQQQDNYGGSYTDKKTGVKTGYYTKKQMAALYPKGGYKIAGAMGAVNTNKFKKKAEIEGVDIYAGKQFDSPGKAVIGYVQVGEGIFVAIIKPVALKRIAIALLGIALLTFGAYCAVNWYDWFPRKLDIDPGAAAISQNSNVPTHSEITIPGYTSINADKQGKTQWNLQNPEGNPCYFQVTLKLADSNRKLYQSGLLPPGTAVRDPELEAMLDPGTYEVLIQYNTFELEGAHNPMNNAVTAAQLVIQ
ncbi:MAG: hypothetical protein RR614_04575 [Eubacterium sp.]